jgi:hypothetical protein
VTVRTDETRTLEILDERLKTLLPEEYQQTYEALEPTPMRSAGLKYGPDGKVAWNEIWGSFCDLAMAGGPPHKGTLLEAATAAQIDAGRERYDEVVDEICRGITMASELDARPSPAPGWVRVSWLSAGMSGWLLRAITMENVAARSEGSWLDLPAAPHYRLEKEIKNVVTVIAKTSHYWLGHMPRTQQRAVADLFAALAGESPLVTPPPPEAAAPAATEVGTVSERIALETGLRPSARRYHGWIGFECASVKQATWMMRALVASNVLSRREDTVVYVPVNPGTDPRGDLVVAAVTRMHRLARLRAT